MKLDPEHLPRIAKDATPAAGAAKRGAVRGATGQGADKPPVARPQGDVSLSPRADRFRQLRTKLESLPDASQADRVAQLKAQVAAGQYNVSGQTIAKALLSDAATAALLGLPASTSG
jgi:flagellar biosynthesis anti-sigma factor FlgM